MTTPLKLRATDAEDIEVLSACLQDALIDFADMTYLKDEGRFIVVATRFRWEDLRSDAPVAAFERVLCGIAFESVRRVRMRGIDPKRDQQRIFELLAIRAEAGALHLVLAGGAEIRLEVSDIVCHLKDLGEPWPVFERPRHPLEESR
ncbi:MAG: DUF2948 family protein [Alphaproteobacteria bacterium]